MVMLRTALSMALALSALALPVRAEPPADQTAAMEQAFDRFMGAVHESNDFVTHHPFYQDEESRASGLAFISSMMIRTLEEDVVQDVDFPFFRVLDFRIREGGDNPDQRYRFARIRA
jgi:hypothetical protein